MDAFGHFVAAQAAVYPAVEAELAAGRKLTHWMWFVFPQLVGLGRSDTARRFALESLLEARAFLSHPLLGPRLLACTRLVNAVEGRSAHDIFGSPDDMKFHSSMTLFHHAAPKEPAFADALAKYFAGREDELTLNLLKGQGDGRQ